MADRVDASVDGMKPSAGDAAVDRVAAEAEDAELSARHNPVLGPGDRGNRNVDGALTAHIAV
jgi:hypothetical protein